MQNVTEAFPFFTDAIAFGNKQTVDKDRIGIDRFAPHLRNAVHLNFAAIEISVKNANPFGRTFAILKLGGARQQHNFVGHLRGRCPNFLAVHHVAAGNFLRECFYRCGVEARVGLSDTEAALILALH